jgi:hypothetical protein
LQVNVERAARQAGISFESELIDAVAAKAAEEIKELEDKRFLLEVRMSLSNIQIAALKKQLMQSKKKDIIAHAMNETRDREKLLTQAMDLHRELTDARKDVAQREEKMREMAKVIDFWKTQALLFQEAANSAMNEIVKMEESG